MSRIVKILITLMLSCVVALAAVDKPPLKSEDPGVATNSTSRIDDTVVQTLTNSDSPLCTIKFRPETNFNYFTVDEVQPTVFVVPFDAGEPAEPYQGGDKYLAEIFRPIGRIPPYARIECVSIYAMNFRFEGIGALQFLRVWQRREVQPVRQGESAGVYPGTKLLFSYGVEVLLSPNATGEYIIYPAEDQANQPPAEPADPAVETTDNATAPVTRAVRQTSYYVFAEGSSPYLLGRGRTVKGLANDTTVVVPCISSKYNQYVKLLWKNEKTGTYQFTADSNDNVQGIKYVRTVGFIVNRRDLRQSTKYPLVPGMYRCVTESSTDFVDVLVTSSPPSPNDLLRLQVERNGASSVKSLCTGPPDSSVSLSRFSANHVEGAALAKCLADLDGASCGSSFHERLDGYTIGKYSALTGLGPAGLLVCTSNVGDVIHALYFTGLDGQIYTQPWREIPIPAQLRLRIERPHVSSDDEPFEGGSYARIFCDVVGDINQPRFVYVTFANGTRTQLGSVNDDEPSLGVHLHSTWKELTCDAGPWDFSGSMYTTRVVDVVHVDCTSEDEFQCANEQCVSKRSICFGRHFSGCVDGSAADFNCSMYYPSGCPQSPSEPVYWQCKNGRCIKEEYRCDADFDCTDESDEDVARCAQDLRPAMLDGTQNFTVLKNQELNIVCEVSIRRIQDKPVFEWYQVQEGRRTRVFQDAKTTVKLDNEGFDLMSVLHLPRVMESNTYICDAVNRFGLASAEYQVSVYDPNPPTTTVSTANTDAMPTKAPPRPEHPASHRFRCEAEGKHPDPRDCQKYHECVQTGSGHFIDYEFSCGAGTVYCDDSQTCGYERDCPCLDGRQSYYTIY